MSHLSRDRLLEAVEADAAPDAAAHLASCARCRSEVEALRRTLDEVRAVDVPEPSPLFWDHLTLRVREAIAMEPALDRPRQTARSWWRPALATLLVLVTAVLVDRGVRQRYRRPDAGRPVAVQSISNPAAAASGPWDLDAGDDWQFIVEVATASAVHGAAPQADEAIDARIGSADLGVSELSADERRELVKLLNDAIAETGVAARPVKGDV
jgi:hypothetical protein